MAMTLVGLLLVALVVYGIASYRDQSKQKAEAAAQKAEATAQAERQEAAEAAAQVEEQRRAEEMEPQQKWVEENLNGIEAYYFYDREFYSGENAGKSQAFADHHWIEANIVEPCKVKLLLHFEQIAKGDEVPGYTRDDSETSTVDLRGIPDSSLSINGLPGRVGDTNFMVVTGDPSWWVAIQDSRVDRDTPNPLSGAMVRVHTVALTVQRRSDAQALLVKLRQFAHQYCAQTPQSELAQ